MWNMPAAEVRHNKTMARRSRDTEGKVNSSCPHMIEAKMWMVEKTNWKTMDAGGHRDLV